MVCIKCKAGWRRHKYEIDPIIEHRIKQHRYVLGVGSFGTEGPIVLYWDFTSLQEFQEIIRFEHDLIRRCDSIVNWESGQEG